MNAEIEAESDPDMPKSPRNILLIALTFLLTACLEQPDEPIRIGINPWPGYELLFLARTQGFFKEEGITVDLVEFSSLGDVRRAFERGQVDGMASSLVEVIQANERSERDPRVFMVTDFSAGADVLVVNSSIKTLQDLKGKRIAAEAASLTMFIVARALEIADLTWDDVTIVPMDQAFIAKTMEEGKIDAAATYPPFSIEILEQPGRHVVFSTSDIPREVVDTVSLTEQILRERPDAAERIVRAWDKALAYARSHSDDAYTIMARRQGISRAEFEASLNGIQLLSAASQRPYFGPNGMLRRIIAKHEAMLRETGQIAGSKNATRLIAETGPQVGQVR